VRDDADRLPVLANVYPTGDWREGLPKLGTLLEDQDGQRWRVASLEADREGRKVTLEPLRRPRVTVLMARLEETMREVTDA
jgi:hypothetical protein